MIGCGCAADCACGGPAIPRIRHTKRRREKKSRWQNQPWRHWWCCPSNPRSPRSPHASTPHDVARPTGPALRPWPRTPPAARRTAPDTHTRTPVVLTMPNPLRHTPFLDNAHAPTRCARLAWRAGTPHAARATHRPPRFARPFASACTLSPSQTRSSPCCPVRVTRRAWPAWHARASRGMASARTCLPSTTFSQSSMSNTSLRRLSSEKQGRRTATLGTGRRIFQPSSALQLFSLTPVTRRSWPLTLMSGRDTYHDVSYRILLYPHVSNMLHRDTCIVFVSCPYYVRIMYVRQDTCIVLYRKRILHVSMCIMRIRA